MQFWGEIPVAGTGFRGQVRGLLADGGQRRGNSFFGLGADAKVGVGLTKDYASGGTCNIGCPNWEAPAFMAAIVSIK
jgi:hypothetical protein